jgi:hypothetical protein
MEARALTERITLPTQIHPGEEEEKDGGGKARRKEQLATTPGVFA